MEQSQKRLRILLADDHPLFRHGLTALLHTCPDIEVVGEATSGDAVVSLAQQVQPDIILMDIQMPGINGIEATRSITQANPAIYILIITMFEDDASVFTAMRAGARGYILKDAQKDDLLRAIRAVGRGEAIFSPAIATRLIDFFTAPHIATVETQPAFPDLTERERELLDLIAQGKSNNEIAQILVLSPRTVRNYVSNIFSKLQVADRAQAFLRARESGLGQH
jgi:DNA-binding NarL/FixJ family response regulator